MWCTAQRKGRHTWFVSHNLVILYSMWKFEVEAPPNGWEIVLRKSRFSMGLNYGPIFRRLLTKVHQILSADAGEIVVCNAVFWLSIYCSILEIFAIDVRSRPKSRQKSMFSVPNFWGWPQILDIVFKIAPISDHVAKFRGDRPRNREDLALKKKRNKERKERNSSKT